MPGPEKWSRKFLFHTISRSQRMTSSVDAILPYFTNLTTSSPFWATSILRNIYHGWSCLTRSEEHFDKIIFDTISRHLPMTSFVTPFCYISLILKLHRLLSNLTPFLGNAYQYLCCLIWSEEKFGNIFFIAFIAFGTSFCYILQLHCLHEQLH